MDKLALLQDLRGGWPYKQDVGGSSPSLPTNPPLGSTQTPQNSEHKGGISSLALPAIPAGALTSQLQTSKGRISQIDHDDFLRFGHLKWTAGSFGGRTAYVYRSVWGEDGKCRTILLHREIMGAKPGQMVDHRNGDTFDNRRENLRLATAAQNAFNSRRQQSKYGFLGVDSQTPGTYRGRVAIAGRAHYTASYPCPILAAVARDILAQRLHGEFAVLNFQFIPLEAA